MIILASITWLSSQIRKNNVPVSSIILVPIIKYKILKMCNAKHNWIVDSDTYKS